MGANKPVKKVQKVEVAEVEEPAKLAIEYAYTYGDFQLEYLLFSNISIIFDYHKPY